VNNGGGTPAAVAPSNAAPEQTAPDQTVPAATDTPAAAPVPTPSAPSCPVPTDIGEPDRTSPAPTLASDGGPAPCPVPNLVGAVPSAGPSVGSVKGTIAAGSLRLSLASPSAASVGDTVTIAGAAADGGDLVAQVVAVKGAALTLDKAASKSVSDVAVQVRAASEVQGVDREAVHRGILETVVDQVLRLFLNV